MTGVADGSVTGRDPAARTISRLKNGAVVERSEERRGRLLCEVHVQVYERDTVPYVQFLPTAFWMSTALPARSRRQ